MINKNPKKSIKKWIMSWLFFEWIGYNCVTAFVLFLSATNFDRTEILAISFIASISFIGGVSSYFVFKKQFNVLIVKYVCDLEVKDDIESIQKESS